MGEDGGRSDGMGCAARRRLRVVGKQATGRQAIDQGHAVFCTADRVVAGIFGDMDVESCATLLRQIYTMLEGLIGEGEGGMGTDQGGKHRIGSIPTFFGIAAILRQAGLGPCRAVSICRFVAEHRAKADVRDALLDPIETAVDGVGGGVVVDQRRRAAAEGIERADAGAGLDRFGVQCPVQTPPDKFKNLVKVFRGDRRRGHPGGEGGVEMGVTVDEAGQHDGAMTIVGLLAGRGHDIRSGLGDGPIDDTQIAAGDAYGIEIEEYGIGQ